MPRTRTVIEKEKILEKKFRKFVAALEITPDDYGKTVTHSHASENSHSDIEHLLHEFLPISAETVIEGVRV